MITKNENNISCVPLKDPMDLCALSPTRKQPAGWGKEGEPAFTLRTAVIPGVAVVKQQFVYTPEVSATLMGRSSRGGGQTNSPGHNADQSVVAVQIESSVTEMYIRRMTPIECERLQGFPDGWTLVPYRKKPAESCADGPRYKALGNSMATNVMRWIGQRISSKGQKQNDSKPCVRIDS